VKKLITIFLLALYGFSVSGASIQFHYCCGKVAGVSVGYEAKTFCQHGKTFKMAGCCQDQQVSMDVDDDQGVASTASVPSPAVLYTAPVFAWESTTALLQADQIIPDTRGSPPASPAVPIYLRNRVFRN
jgi:hypothetical protein